jgi:hypothetical protein
LLASEIMRSLRGTKRSRPGFSRRLGYRSNIAQRWETGLCWPTATSFFDICAQVGLDAKARIAKFLRREPPWLASVDLASPSGVAALLGELRGHARVSDIAQRSATNRFSVARWLKGTAIPKLPELLRVIDACSRRALDFVAAFVDPATLPSVAASWQQLELARDLAYTHPLSHAVSRALELQSHPGGRTEAELARKLGISLDQVQSSLALLAASGQVRKTRHGWAPRRHALVDTGADPARARALKLDWARLAIDRLSGGAPGHCGYSLFAISHQGLQQLREVQLAYVREMQSIIAASGEGDCVALYCAQLLDLAVPESNLFPSRSD